MNIVIRLNPVRSNKLVILAHGVYNASMAGWETE